MHRGMQLRILVNSLEFPLKNVSQAGPLNQCFGSLHTSTKEAKETNIDKGMTKLRKIHVTQNFLGAFRKLMEKMVFPRATD